MYRKSREDIAEWLPEMIEIEMPVQLDAGEHGPPRTGPPGPQQRHRPGPRRRGQGPLRRARPLRTCPQRRTTAGLMGEVMSRLLAMRMLSSHPALLKISADDFDSPVSQRGSKYASHLRASRCARYPPYLSRQVRCPLGTRHGDRGRGPTAQGGRLLLLQADAEDDRT